MKAYEMQATVLSWKRCPSVYEGGKPYFHVAFCQGNKFTVVWDRQEESWIVTKNDVYVTNVASAQKGMRYAERMAGAGEGA
jgi:hypothetical protein